MVNNSHHKINFVFIYVKFINLYLIKEVGTISFHFYKNYNFNSKIVCYQNDREYPFLNKYTPGLKVEFLKRKYRTFNQFLNFEIPVIIYLFKNAKKFGILSLIHLTTSSAIYCVIYKLLNPNGFVYLKTDSLEEIITDNKIRTNNYINYFFYSKRNVYTILFNTIRVKIGKFLSKIFVKKLNLMSVESKKFYNIIKNYPKIKNKVIYSPNGIDDIQVKSFGIKRIPYNQKENIILSVGRLGTYQKGTEILLDAIVKIKDMKDWRFFLIGTIESEFKNKIKSFYDCYPNFRDKVIFTGEISDRKKLFQFFQKSKIFCFPSRFESFGIALVEAGYFGNYLVSSNFPPAQDITLNGTLGKLFNIDDSDELAKILEELIHNENILEENYLKIQKHIEDNFLWRKIVSNLFDEIKKRRENI